MKRIGVTKILLLALFTFSVFTGGVHSLSHSTDGCDTSHSTIDNIQVDALVNTQSGDSNPLDDFDFNEHRHGCGHQCSLLLVNQKFTYLENAESMTNLTILLFISDPHPQGPFQPPRA